MNNTMPTTWTQRLQRYGLNAMGGTLAGLGTLTLFSDTPMVGVGWLPAGLLLIPRSRQWLKEKCPIKLNDRRAYGLATVLWLVPLFGLNGQVTNGQVRGGTSAIAQKSEKPADAPKPSRPPASSVFRVTVEVTQDDMLLCSSKQDLASVAQATDPTNEKLKRDYAHDATTYGRIVSDPSFARREMAAIGMAQMRLVSAGKCVLPKKGSWASTSRWGIQDHKPMDPIEVEYQDQTYWAHAVYFQK